MAAGVFEASSSTRYMVARLPAGGENDMSCTTCISDQRAQELLVLNTVTVSIIIHNDERAHQ